MFSTRWGYFSVQASIDFLERSDLEILDTPLRVEKLARNSFESLTEAPRASSPPPTKITAQWRYFSLAVLAGQSSKLFRAKSK